ncbi:MAG: DEAD/DEAH box helicase [Chthoniobacteraceae bacterium]
MNTFADDLADRIRSHAGFWQDFDAISAAAIARLLPGVIPINPSSTELQDETLSRILRSAVVFAQATNDSEKGLAQEIALYSALAATQDLQVAITARDLLHDIGNHPGARHLVEEWKLPSGTLTSHLRNSLLAAINRVKIAEKERELTDFQRRVWDQLPQTFATSVSAPTSAGKSFVILEYLAQQAIIEEQFTAVFIAPTRALLGEVQGKITNRLLEHEQSIRISTIPTLDPGNKPKQIFVLTQERLQVLLAAWDGSFDLVIVDEAQAIGDDSRGMILQDCLEVIQSRSTETRFLFLAPGATGFENLANAIDIAKVTPEATALSPVVQNRIIVDPTLGNENSLDISLLSETRSIKVGTYSSERGFGNAKTRLAAVALELGSNGGSLVYGTGPADAEEVAQQLASDLKEQESEELKELSKFISDHIHPKYSLVRHVLKGVGVHYGKMPGLLRESLEQAFKNAKLKYLVCTTTLFQGINLPARNVFIDTPTRGRGDELDPAALWNFAGRAGRLGKDVVGNVFLVDYGSWKTKALSERVPFSITPSFRETVAQHREKVIQHLRGEPIESFEKSDSLAESAAGLLISRAARGSVGRFVDRTLSGLLSKRERDELVEIAAESFKSLKLPAETLASNWTVNPYGQARLLKRFREKITAGDVESLIPAHPVPWSKALVSRYVGIFSRLNREIFGKSASAKFNNLLTSMSLDWMGGKPLPVIIEKRLKYLTKENGSLNPDSAIRKVFEFMEDTLRFKYVQLGRAYVDLLRVALREANLEQQARAVYDFSLALELGVSSVAGQAFVELGLSRITAATLEGLIPDSNPSVERAREWLAGLESGDLKVSRVIWDELKRKEYVEKTVS